jgi:hypothetical protein
MAGPGAVPGVDPSQVSTPDELAVCLDGLRRRRDLSYEAMEAAAKQLLRSGATRLEPLAKSTVGEIVTGKRLPTRAKLLTFLAVCDVTPADRAQWLAAWERASTADLARPGGAVRIRDVRPRLLGVHAAISVPGVPDDVPPQYVLRDVDTSEFGIWARVKAAAREGGFVLLVGGSSVGKTRCAFEAVKRLLPDWWLAHPAGPAEVTAMAHAPPPKTVVWLDELQRYLDGEHGLACAAVQALVTAAHPTVIIGTLWPDRYSAYVAVPRPGAADPHARERQVLGLATVVRVAANFSPAEQGRARVAAAGDRRLQVALGVADYGLTQTLAAAPQLVAQWKDAQATNPYAWAVLTAALDAARLGAQAPLSSGFLRASAPGYCTPRQRAEAPSDSWFESAVSYATAKLHGTVAALSPQGTGMGQIDGYKAADYLVQHATGERRDARVPASTWDALLSHHRDHVDDIRLGVYAESRLLYCYAIPLYRHAADAGDRYAARQLAGLLYKREDRDGLQARADAGDPEAARVLVKLLRERGDTDGLRARARTGDSEAARVLARLLSNWGDLNGAEQILRAQAKAGDEYAARELAGMLYKRGDLDEAEEVLRAQVKAGDGNAARELAGLLRSRGDLDGAIRVLHARANIGDVCASRELAWVLSERDDLDALNVRAGTGDQDAAMQLAWRLRDHSDLDALRARAASSDRYAAEQLAELLRGHGNLDELRARADVGDMYAARELALLLRERGDQDRLQVRVDAGDWYAARQLSSLLREGGDLDGAIQVLQTLADAGDQDAARQLTELLYEHGDLDGAIHILRARADGDNQDATRELAWLLRERGDLDEAEQILRPRAAAGDWYAARQLSSLLREGGDLDGAIQVLRVLAETGDKDSAEELVWLLRERGDLDGLRDLAGTGDRGAAEQLAELLRDRGDLDEAEQILRARADAGDWYAARQLAELLRKRGDLDGLRALVDTGEPEAVDQLARLIAEQDRGEEAMRLRQFGLNPDGSIACS